MELTINNNLKTLKRSLFLSKTTSKTMKSDTNGNDDTSLLLHLSPRTSVSTSGVLDTCELCGDPHEMSTCAYLEIKHHVTDNEIPTRAKLTLPDILRLEKMSSGCYDVLTRVDLKSGTQFGPLEAKQMFTLNPEIVFPLKLFSPNEYFTEYYLDTSNEKECNWLMFVQPAFNADEQNMICYQKDNNIYYVTTCDVKTGVALKVWYGPSYAKRMNKELLKSPNMKTQEYDIDRLLKKQQNLIEKDVWNCKFCDFHDENVTKFACHISEHYSAQLKKVCKYCKSTFSSHMALKKHMHVVHTPVSKSTIDDKASNTKNFVKDSMLGGPLLNEILTDSMDNTNLLIPQSELTQFDMENQNMLLDNDSLNLGVDNLIEDNDNFNFDINDDKEQNVCDICMKPFNKLKQLIQHLQMHTGKYICPECLIIFSRRENLKSHKCNLTEEMQQKCPVCSKTFSLKKYLSRHILIVHGKKYQCEKCTKICTSEQLLYDHVCSNSTAPGIDKEKYSCMLCNKKFARESYMKRHLKSHSVRKEDASQKGPGFICDVCANSFDTLKNLKRHMPVHFQKRFHACNQCDKKFIRKDTLEAHISARHSTEVFPCELCFKKFKSRKSLKNHQFTHKKSKRYDCDLCNQKFFVRSNMERHKRNKHLNAIMKDNKQINIESYKCSFCFKSVKLRSSLVRHVKKYHGNEQFDPKSITKDFTTIDVRDTNKAKRVCKQTHTSNNNNNNDNASVNKNCKPISSIPVNKPIKENSPPIVPIKKNEENNISNVVTHELQDTQPQNMPQQNVVDMNNLELDLGPQLNISQGVNVNNQEVCLSMPELGDVEQNITLGDNAFILDNGTIVEPLDQGNFVVYILGQP